MYDQKPILKLNLKEMQAYFKLYMFEFSIESKGTPEIVNSYNFTTRLQYLSLLLHILISS